MLVVPTAGCFDFLNNDDVLPEGTGGASGTGGAGGTAGTGGTGTTTATVPLGCIPSGTSNAVDNSCGIFVSPNGNDDTGDGTKENPYATLTKGLAKGTILYACADEAKPYVELVSVDTKGTYLFGGLDCRNLDLRRRKQDPSPRRPARSRSSSWLWYPANRGLLDHRRRRPRP
ncbi:MAG: hypothetical protein R3B70_31620 [Polyangiaceae bacterium]